MTGSSAHMPPPHSSKVPRTLPSVSTVSRATAARAAAIAATQRSSNHYFQRPDAPHLEYDPAATSMSGYRAQVDAGKRAGSWTGNVALTASSPGYEINDLGFQTSTDRIVLDPNVTYEHNKPGRLLRRWSVRAGPDNVWTYGWELVRRQSYLTMQAQLANY